MQVKFLWEDSIQYNTGLKKKNQGKYRLFWWDKTRSIKFPRKINISHQIKILQQQLLMLTIKQMDIKWIMQSKKIEFTNKLGKHLPYKLRNEKEKNMEISKGGALY